MVFPRRPRGRRARGLRDGPARGPEAPGGGRCRARACAVPAELYLTRADSRDGPSAILSKLNANTGSAQGCSAGRNCGRGRRLAHGPLAAEKALGGPCFSSGPWWPCGRHNTGYEWLNPTAIRRVVPVWLPGGAGEQSTYQVVVVRKSGHYAGNTFRAHLL